MKMQGKSTEKGWLRGLRQPTQWLVRSTLMIALAWAMVAQRIPKRLPSPADPGMRLSGVPMRTPLKKTFPEPPYAAVAEAPEVKTPDIYDDPNAGDTPEDDDLEVPSHSPIELDPEESKPWGTITRRPAAVTVKSYELTVPSAGSVIGEEGQHVLVVHGSGFMQAETGPMIHFSDSLCITNTHVNAQGTEIYAVISSEQAMQLDTMSNTEFYVQNPGGYFRMQERWGRLTYQREQFRDSLRNAHESKYFRNNFITR